MCAKRFRVIKCYRNTIKSSKWIELVICLPLKKLIIIDFSIYIQNYYNFISANDYFSFLYVKRGTPALVNFRNPCCQIQCKLTTVSICVCKNQMLSEYFTKQNESLEMVMREKISFLEAKKTTSLTSINNQFYCCQKISLKGFFIFLQNMPCSKAPLFDESANSFLHLKSKIRAKLYKHSVKMQDFSYLEDFT